MTLDPRRLLRHFAVLKRSVPSVDRAIEESLIPLGTEVLWIRDYEEIPKELGKLYEAGGGQWQLVF